MKPLYVLASDKAGDFGNQHTCYVIVNRVTGVCRAFYSLPWYWDLWLRILGAFGLAVMSIEVNAHTPTERKP